MTDEVTTVSQQKPTAEMTEREKLIAVADGFHALSAMQREQRVTSALMIRACVKAIQRVPTSYDDAKQRNKIRIEREQAYVGLEELAKMLERS